MNDLRVRPAATTHDPLHMQVITWGRALMCVHLGCLFLTNPGMFKTLPMLSSMGRFMCQSTWGWLCIACGVARIAGILVNPAFRTRYYLRYANSITAGVTCFIWLQLTLSYMAAQVQSPGLAILPYLLMLDVYCVFEAVKEASQHAPKTKVEDGRGERVHRVAGVGAIRR